MAKLVDALGLGPSGATLESSSLSVRTMFHFLNNFEPSPILFTVGTFTVGWYGFFIAIAMMIAIFVASKLTKKTNIKEDIIVDISFYLIIFGVLGARLYDVLLELPYYVTNPQKIFYIWEGGLAIHGGILAGILVLIYFVKKKNLDFFTIAAIFAPALALAQSIGRFGNYFNQELFGLPTSLPWGIFISANNRPAEFLENSHFHPTFLYESLGSLVIFLIMMFLIYKRNIINKNSSLILIVYMLSYSILRFFLEFIRIDYAPEFIGLRVPQLFSILLFLVAIYLYFKFAYAVSKKKKVKN